MANLASLYKSQGQYAKAQPLLEETLRRRRKVLGEAHPSTLNSMATLASLYIYQGQFTKALRFSKNALRRTRKILGENHPDILTQMNNLAWVYLSMRQYEMAQPLFEISLRRSKVILGENHPETLTSMNNLGRLYLSMGQYAKAQPILEETLWRKLKRLGGNHPSTLLTMSLLATLHLSIGSWNEADLVWRSYLFHKNRFLNQVLWAADERTRNSYLAQEKRNNNTLLSYYQARNTPESAQEALLFSLTRKGLLLKVSSEVMALARASADLAVKDKATALAAFRQEAAQRTLAGPKKMKLKAFHARMRVLEGRIGKLEAELGRSVQKLARGNKAIKPANVIMSLGANEVLLDFLAYTEVEFKTGNMNGNKLMAIVVAPSRDPPIALVPLGDLELISLGPLSYKFDFRSLFQIPGSLKNRLVVILAFWWIISIATEVVFPI